jgi:23S rRNA (uracil1939-C5)-methyltransferase
LTDEGKLGFVGADTSLAQPIIPIAECHLPEQSLNSLWPRLDFEPGTNIERVSLRSGNDDDLMLILESSSPETPELEVEADISVAHIFEENTVVMAGNDHVVLSVLGRNFRVSAASFFQVNTAMAGKMVEHLAALLPITASTTLLDVYCGVGFFSAFLAPGCGRVIGIEASPAACEDFCSNLDEFHHVELYQGRAEDVLPGLVGRIGNRVCLLVDPPRAGLEKSVVDGVLSLDPQVVAYVSCDPSTLARDAARLLKGGYRLKDVTPFDLFPQTYHIESIALFER